MNAVDDGIVSGNFTLADIAFLVALILFAIGAFLAWPTKTLWAFLVALGLACVSLGLLVL